MIRKTVLTTAIVGAGLASTAGAAFAGDAPSSDSGSNHDGSHSHSKHVSSHHGCSNTALGEIDNSGAKTLVGVLDGSQGALGLNICDNLNNNQVLSNNHLNIAGHDLPS